MASTTPQAQHVGMRSSVAILLAVLCEVGAAPVSPAPVREAPTPRLLAEYDVQAIPSSIAIDSTGHLITYMVGFERVEQLDTRSGLRQTLYDFHPMTFLGASTDLVISDTGRWLAGGGYGTLVILEQPSGPPLRTIRCPGSWWLSIAASPEGDRIAGSSPGPFGFGIWSVGSGDLLRQFPADPLAPAHALAWSPRGTLIAASAHMDSPDGIITLWNPENGAPVRTLRGAGAARYGPRFSPDGRYLVAVARSGALVSWSVNSGKIRWRFTVTPPGAIPLIEYSPDGRLILIASADDALVLVDAASGHEVARWAAHPEEGVGAARFSPSSPLVVSASKKGHVKLWDIFPFMGSP